MPGSLCEKHQERPGWHLVRWEQAWKGHGSCSGNPS